MMRKQQVDRAIEQRYGAGLAHMSRTHIYGARCREALKILSQREDCAGAWEFAQLRDPDLNARLCRDLEVRWGAGLALISEDQRCCEITRWTIETLLLMPSACGFSTAQQLVLEIIEGYRI